MSGYETFVVASNLILRKEILLCIQVLMLDTWNSLVYERSSLSTAA